MALNQKQQRESIDKLQLGVESLTNLLMQKAKENFMKDLK
jgi:hypothetical protein